MGFETISNYFGKLSFVLFGKLEVVEWGRSITTAFLTTV